MLSMAVWPIHFISVLVERIMGGAMSHKSQSCGNVPGVDVGTRERNWLVLTVVGVGMTSGQRRTVEYAHIVMD